jgi:hypothetical protein
MNFSMTGQEKGDLLIQVTSWVGLTVNETALIQNYTLHIKYKIFVIGNTSLYQNRWLTGEYDYIIFILKFYDNKVWANVYKTLKYEFRIHTKNPSN